VQYAQEVQEVQTDVQTMTENKTKKALLCKAFYSGAGGGTRTQRAIKINLIRI
jgi:hypothetical protein